MVRQRIVNPCHAGSSPAALVSGIGKAWSFRFFWKEESAGSNPAFPIYPKTVNLKMFNVHRNINTQVP